MLFTVEDQNTRWLEHCKEVLNQPSPKEISDFNLEAVQPELDVKTNAITKQEVKEAVKNVNNIAAGVDQITAELIKESGEVTTNAILKLLNQC